MKLKEWFSWPATSVYLLQHELNHSPGSIGHIGYIFIDYQELQL